MQSSWDSLLETIVNILVGFLVALLSQLIIFPAYGIQTSLHTNLQITGWFTLVSFLRGYCLRRWFNGRHIVRRLVAWVRENLL